MHKISSFGRMKLVSLFIPCPLSIEKEDKSPFPRCFAQEIDRLLETQRSSKLSMQIFGCQLRGQQGHQRLVSVSNLNL